LHCDSPSPSSRVNSGSQRSDQDAFPRAQAEAQRPPAHMNAFRPTFDRAWRDIGAAPANANVFDRLAAAYAEPHRKYHSTQHLQECLQLLDSVHEQAVRPHEVELALWFHDAIYDVKRSDNEERSAAWARTELEKSGAPTPAVERVVDLVLVTRHTGQPSSEDQQLLVDIDLAILGAPQARFAEYESQIRAEYAFVPGWLFRRKRKAILRSFLDRSRIFGTAHFHAELEQRARVNLAGAVA
jgi:predicted metal-dependent HD superfamily phosphohydrolase